MALYEYRCLDCLIHYELFQHMDDPPETVCESCGGSVERIVSPPMLQFHGSGFYCNDYKDSDK